MMVNSKETAQKDALCAAEEESLLLFMRGFLGIFAASGSLFLLFFNSPLAWRSIIVAEWGIPAAIIVSALAAGALFIIKVAADRIANAKTLIWAKTIFLAGAIAIPFSSLLKTWWPLALPFISAGLAAAVFLWSSSLCRLSHRLLVSLTSASFFFGISFAGLVSVLKPAEPIVTILESALLLFSLAMLHLDRSEPATPLLQVSKATSKKRASTVQADRWTYSIVGADFGFITGLSLYGMSPALKSTASEPFLQPISISLAFVLAGVLLFVFRPRFEYAIERHSKDFFALMIVAGTLPLPFLACEAQMLCLMALLVVTFAQVIIVINASLEFIRFEQLSPAWYMGETALVAGGIAAGTLLAYIGLVEDAPSYLEPFFCYAISLANILAQKFMNNGIYPTPDQFDQKAQKRTPPRKPRILEQHGLRHANVFQQRPRSGRRRGHRVGQSDSR